MSIANSLVTWLNAEYPDRDWDQQCARLVWNVIYYATGLDREPTAYDPAKAAYRASRIESQDPLAAPAGAIHYWQNPGADGHVAVDLGGGYVLMTGTPEALGEDGWQCGTNYGVTTVDAYTRARRNPYLGWSTAYGSNPQIVGAFLPTPIPAPPKRKRKKPMTICVARATKHAGNHHVRLFDLNSGEEHTYEADSQEYIRNVALTYGCAPEVPVSYISDGHYDKIGRELAARRDTLNGHAPFGNV